MKEQPLDDTHGVTLCLIQCDKVLIQCDKVLIQCDKVLIQRHIVHHNHMFVCYVRTLLGMGLADMLPNRLSEAPLLEAGRKREIGGRRRGRGGREANGKGKERRKYVRGESLGQYSIA
jgi:hypothetical protein